MGPVSPKPWSALVVQTLTRSLMMAESDSHSDVSFFGVGWGDLEGHQGMQTLTLDSSDA